MVEKYELNRANYDKEPQYNFIFLSPTINEIKNKEKEPNSALF